MTEQKQTIALLLMAYNHYLTLHFSRFIEKKDYF